MSFDLNNSWLTCLKLIIHFLNLSVRNIVRGMYFVSQKQVVNVYGIPNE